MFFSKSAKESHTLPPAKVLGQNFTWLASDFRLRSAFDVISLDPFLSDVSLPLSAWNFARVSFSSTHSANTVGKRSTFLTLALHLLSVDSSSRPFESTRFRYSCIRNWVVRWSPCALGTSRTLCAWFDVVDDLSCGGRSWFELMLLVLLRKKQSSSFAGSSMCLILFFRFVNIGFYWQFFLVCERSLTKPFSRLSGPGSCACLLPFLSCADCTWVPVCVCSVCACENV